MKTPMFCISLATIVVPPLGIPNTQNAQDCSSERGRFSELDTESARECSGRTSVALVAILLTGIGGGRILTAVEFCSSVAQMGCPELSIDAGDTPKIAHS